MNGVSFFCEVNLFWFPNLGSTGNNMASDVCAFVSGASLCIAPSMSDCAHVPTRQQFRGLLRVVFLLTKIELFKLTFHFFYFFLFFLIHTILQLCRTDCHSMLAHEYLGTCNRVKWKAIIIYQLCHNGKSLFSTFRVLNCKNTLLYYSPNYKPNHQIKLLAKWIKK